MFYIYSTCKNIEEAKKLSERILNEKLGACVNYWPVNSFYKAEEGIKEVSEVMMMIITPESNTEKINRLISLEHSYAVPVVAGVNIRRINRAFKRWVQERLS